jgi:hypothetical protein
VCLVGFQGLDYSVIRALRGMLLAPHKLSGSSCHFTSPRRPETNLHNRIRLMEVNNTLKIQYRRVVNKGMWMASSFVQYSRFESE